MQPGEDPARFPQMVSTSSGQGWRGNPPSAAGGAVEMSLDLQLSDLRRSLDVATTKIDGQLAALLQRSDYAEQRAREHAERFAAELAAQTSRSAAHESRMEGQDGRMDRIERRVYFMAGMAAAVGSSTAVILHGH
jgi:hypothetical protein